MEQRPAEPMSPPYRSSSTPASGRYSRSAGQTRSPTKNYGEEQTSSQLRRHTSETLVVDRPHPSHACV
ncbi:hypothetical protein DPMN_191382 [Dreissena polymorpha]|uniref:Uncharacterized protein n=1 Tax=Dreissena polymorpha TaxID=45954 RepID=A0A9D4BFQ3_DREPO|nr:hypothetical protein DPMN_191382 [Dreissena polymorpha]